MGIVIAVMLVSVFNLSIWKDSIPQKLLTTWLELIPLLGVVLLLNILVLLKLHIFLFPLSILSTLTVIGILSLVYSVLLIMIWKRDNTCASLREYLPWWVSGLACAFFQILIMDALRLAITGTWAGFTL